MLTLVKMNSCATLIKLKSDSGFVYDHVQASNTKICTCYIVQICFTEEFFSDPQFWSGA